MQAEFTMIVEWSGKIVRRFCVGNLQIINMPLYINNTKREYSDMKMENEKKRVKAYMNVPGELIEEVDSFVGSGKRYSTRTELIREALRSHVEELIKEKGERLLALDSAKGGRMVSVRNTRKKLMDAMSEYMEATKGDDE